MILIEDAKYSCLECIRGHRSSQCRHYMRPLLQVRSKGRPNVSANGNPNHRIAVFAEEIDDANCNSKLTPVVILKATPKQIIDLVNGEVIGPYEERNSGNSTPSPSDRTKSGLGSVSKGTSTVGTPLTGSTSTLFDGVSSRDPIVSTSPAPTPIKLCCSSKNAASTYSTPSKSCCSSSAVPADIPAPKQLSCCCEGKSAPSNGVSKPKSSCGCNNSKRKGTKIFKSKILQKYLKNHLKELEIEKLQQRVPAVKMEETQSPFNDIPIPQNAYADNNAQFIHQNSVLPNNPLSALSAIYANSNAFDIVSVSSCSIPGKCSCITNCTCAGCITHGVQNNDVPGDVFDPLLQGSNYSIEQYFNKVQILPDQVPLNAATTLTGNSYLLRDNGQYQAYPKLEMPQLKQEASYPMNVIPLPQQPTQLDSTYQLQPEKQPLQQNHHQQPQQQHQQQQQQQQYQQLQQPLHGNSDTSTDFRTTQIPLHQNPTAVTYATVNDLQTSSPGSYRQLPINSETSDTGCMCPSDDCNCLNCETHGIIDGLKLDEYFFGPNSKLDKRLLEIFDSSSYTGGV